MGKLFKWPIAGGRVLGPAPFFVVGILNITPDSFYDGGTYYYKDKAVDHALDMLDQGADIVDIGGESTRPYSKRISREVEMDRIYPVILDTLKKKQDAIISVDTYKSQVAKDLLQAGVSIINDVTACGIDPELKDVLAQFKPGYVLMHSKGRPEEMQESPTYSDVIKELLNFFESNLNELINAGLPEERIVLDPGIGFGKNLEHNLKILQEIDKFFIFDRPIYLGLSNKTIWGKLLGLSPEDREIATQTATALLANKGVCLHRVHNIEKTLQTLKIVSSMKKESDNGGLIS